MHQAIGIIASNSGTDQLQGITKVRPLSAAPFGGRYQVMDFPRSCIINAGISKIGIVMPYRYRSLLNDPGAGKGWHQSGGGLEILHGSNLGLRRRRWHLPLRDLLNSSEFLEEGDREDIVFSEANYVANVNVSHLLNYQRRLGADVTLVYKQGPPEVGDTHELLRLRLEKPDWDSPAAGAALIKGWWDDESPNQMEAADSAFYLGIGVIRRSLLKNLVFESPYVATADLFDALVENLDSVRIVAFEHKGFFGSITSVKSYFDCNLALLQPKVREELFAKDNPIHTSQNNSPPTEYLPNASVSNALIDSGCKINGRIENSVIFPEVEIGANSEVKNCIIMQGAVVGKNAKLENAILDKFCAIHDNIVLKGSPDWPVVVSKNALL